MSTKWTSVKVLYLLDLTTFIFGWECKRDKNNPSVEIHVDELNHQIVYCNFGCCHKDSNHPDWPCCPNTGPIIGIVTAVVCLVAIIIGCYHVLCRKRQEAVMAQDATVNMATDSSRLKMYQTKGHKHFHSIECDTDNSSIAPISKL